MTIQEYSKFTTTTNCYPEEFTIEMIDILLIGLVEEIIEFLMSDLDKFGEAGDITWYITAIDRLVSGFLIIDYAMKRDYSFLEIAKFAQSTVKKFIRSDFDRQEKIKRCRKIVMITLEALSNAGYNLADLMESNTKKLTDRKARGVIKGEGDYR
jgi:hypothetical protein